MKLMKMTKIIQIILLIKDGVYLFFVLLFSLLSKKAFNYYWNKYEIEPLKHTYFNLCVNWLLYKGKKYNMSYEQINVLIFCFIWPLITIISILINILLIITYLLYHS